MKRLPRTLGTLLVAWLAAELCVWLGTPIPWMLGPLLITALASMAGAPTHSANLLRNMGQWVIGTALGLYFTPQVSALVLAQWWAIVLAVVWALALGAFFGLWLQRRHGAELSHLSPRALLATTYFSGSIGGASEMTMLAERYGARTDLVAAAHSMRLVMVVIAVPFGMQWAQSQWGLTVDASLLPGTRLAQWPGLLWLGLLTALGGWLMLKMGRTNPWFMGPLVASMALTLAGWEWSAVPTALSNAAQLVLGVSLGIRFRREFVKTAPRWLASVAWGSALMMGVSLLFGMALAWGTGLHPATMILGTAPGGITEMAITAKVLQLGVPVVTAFQVCRLVAVLLMVGPLFGWVARRMIKA
ncbi:AbrB family transcriptional regulator [Limnohabitans sp. Rim28]|uniref:AbrB family transcriptional regulator n=1 Tax=Limnohabitans sp. Rim28 TaxID=1100720 RepID=UPI0002E1DF0E|nr:AbrB family transcriptional regulator [Limnohabitans sp. Rim28]